MIGGGGALRRRRVGCADRNEDTIFLNRCLFSLQAAMGHGTAERCGCGLALLLGIVICSEESGFVWQFGSSEPALTKLRAEPQLCAPSQRAEPRGVCGPAGVLRRATARR